MEDREIGTQRILVRSYAGFRNSSANLKIRVNGVTGPAPPTPTAFNVRPDGNTLRVTFNENLSDMFRRKARLPSPPADRP